MNLPFPIRGTIEWDDRELERQIKGCSCLSYGRIPRSQMSRRVPIHHVRVVPGKRRMNELRARQDMRIRHEL